MRIQRSLRGSVAAACGVALSCAALAADVGGLTLAAVATDVDAAVFRDEAGALRKVAVGERLPGDAWRLAAIRNGRAVLTAERRLQGRAVEMLLDVGERAAPPPVDPLDRLPAGPAAR